MTKIERVVEIIDNLKYNLSGAEDSHLEEYLNQTIAELSAISQDLAFDPTLEDEEGQF